MATHTTRTRRSARQLPPLTRSPLTTVGLDVESRPYLWLNLVGSVILTALALHEHQWGFLLLESVWAVVSAYGLVSVARKASSLSLVSSKGTTASAPGGMGAPVMMR